MFQKRLSLPECGIKMDEVAGRFAGYASVFNKVDASGDTILKGAYTRTLREHGMPKMFVQHDSMSLPVGKWLSAVENDHGLAVEGEFTPGMARADEAYAALKHGTVDGLSIGYLLKKDDYQERDGGRTIRRISRLPEISLVTFPMDSFARVDLSSVKTEEIEQLETIRDFECFLRDAGGLSKGLTEALVNRAKIVFGRGDPAADEIDAKAVSELEKAVQKTASLMTGIGTAFLGGLKS